MFKSSSKLQESKGKKKGNIWQLFRATNFESLMYPCFTICRILGMFSYKINALNIKICKICYVLSIIIASVISVCTLIALYVLNFSKEVEYTNVPITKKLHDNWLLVSGGFMQVVTFILNKPRMHLIQTILELSLRLPLETYQNLSRLIHTKDIFGLVYIFVEASIIFCNLPENFLSKIFVLYNILFSFQMDMLYMNCVFVLKACFKQINDNLINLEAPVTNDESYSFRSIYYNGRNSLMLMELKALKKQHLAVSDTVQVLNKIFSVQLIANMILTMTRSSLKMGLLIWTCETGKNQAAAINTTVHSVLNSTSDKEIKHELQLFSLQLMHHKNVFSAKWFNMDVALLTAMMRGITTHLVILIQFLYISCNE
ncbi:uncharacterized protein LOC120357926 [Solenopsis invicta]|uniref:uncharacterized protein LOC120357926 n=1 Tax=Solenopsis invicta TaxID=13686 RepID=UPI00193E325C|nr:uncharacterized protein LOC120357926 [Solenopsis invicta]